MDDQKTRRLDDPTADDSCPKCDGPMKWAALRTTGPFAVASKEGQQRVWDFTGLEPKVCSHCGFTEFYAAQPEKL
jgi:predicted nucleic-acid-binding Zn-ribbon protein